LEGEGIEEEGMNALARRARLMKLQEEENRTLVNAIAKQMWELHGGCGRVDWRAVDRDLSTMTMRASRDARRVRRG
jgi:hypothetical protein